MKPTVRSLYSPRAPSRLVCLEESRTIQSGKDDADINVIVRRFGVTNGPVPGSARMPMHGDFTGISDYRSALDAVRAAAEDFSKLDSSVRARFHNNPQELLVFCSDPRNLDEARKLGIAVPAEPPKAPPPAP